MEAQNLYRYSHCYGRYIAPAGGDYEGFLDGFTYPVDVAFGQRGTLYVLNRGRGLQRVTILTAEEEPLGNFGRFGQDDGQMTWPSSIALDREGNVYVSDDALHRISIFDSQGNFLNKWGVQGNAEGELDRPSSIAFDRDDNLLVADGMNHRIQRFTKDGSHLGGWGGQGQGSGQFNIPWGISLDAEGNVYVADWRNDRIQKFDADGNHVAGLGVSGQGEGEFRRPSGVAVDRDGNICVADWGNERVQVLGPDGGHLLTLWGDGTTLSRWAMDYVLSSEGYLEQREKADWSPVLELSPDDDVYREHASGLERHFWGPTSVRIDDEGNMYVVESSRHRIQVYRRSE